MEDRIKKIVDSLTKGTKANKISWESTDRENEYCVKLQNGGITVDKWQNFSDGMQDDHELVDIAFLTKAGEVIERVVFEKEVDRQDYRLLADLHDIARRNHMRIDEQLDNILGELERTVGDDS
jgi:hypothetical protein